MRKPGFIAGAAAGAAATYLFGSEQGNQRRTQLRERFGKLRGNSTSANELEGDVKDVIGDVKNDVAKTSRAITEKADSYRPSKTNAHV